MRCESPFIIMQATPFDYLIVRYQSELDDLNDILSNKWYSPKSEKAKNPNFWAEFSEAETRASQTYTTLVALQRESMGMAPMTGNLIYTPACKMNAKREQKWFHFYWGRLSQT